MKTFKELVIGDEFYILKLTLGPSREMKWEKVKLTCKSVVTSTGFTTLYYRGKSDNIEGNISVDPKKTSHKTEFRAELKERVYFTDRDSMEVFLKNEVEQARNYIKDVELSYINLWDTSDEIKHYKKGDFIFFMAFDSVALYDGEGMAYFADGEKIILTEERSLRTRRADRSEISDYLLYVKNRILFSQDKERTSKILEKCGYKYENREFIQV
jgi:hypothetical protein